MRILFFILLFSSLFNSQVIKDSILGKPKFVKEYVIFLNNSGPFTFMSGDSEYGHAVIMIPKFLRTNMTRSWFETNFCRYINNETHYDKDRKITKEIWFHKSGKIVDDYDYTYDNLGRLKEEKSKNNYSEDTKLYFYEGNNKKPKFREYNSKWKDEPSEKFVNNLESLKPLFITKFDTLTKTDSIFAVTDFIWRKVGERSFQEGKDSIYREKLAQVKMYDENFRLKEAKFFDYKYDYKNENIFQTGHSKYEYDSLGNIKRKAEIQDGKYHYYIISENGKYIKEEKEGNFSKSSSTEYSYLNDGKLEQKTGFSNGNISHQVRFEYKNNLIEKLFYLDTWGKKNDNLKANIITFKYKFDKQKNWIECIKNVDGKDLYMWKREIQYY